MTFPNFVRTASELERSVLEQRIPLFILNDTLILSGRSIESTSVIAFPVNSASSSIHRSEVIEVFLALFSCVPMCGSVRGTAQTL